MEKNIYEKLDDWLKLAISKKKIYMTIAEAEINKQDTLSLLADVHRFERKSIDSININKHNLELIKKYLLKNEKKVQIENINGDNYAEIYHLSNIIAEYEKEIDIPTNQKNIFELINHLNLQEKRKSDEYADLFQSNVIRNVIKLIDLIIPSINDVEVKEFLIKYKYLLIYITPSYEELYIYFNKVLPFININDTKSFITGYTNEQFLALNKYNIENLSKPIINELLYIEDIEYMLPNRKIHAAKLLITLAGYLVSIQDKTIILKFMQIFDEHFEYFNSISKKHIEYTLKKTLEIIDELLENKEKKLIHKEKRH